VLADSDVTSLEILLTPILGLAYGYGLRLVRNSAEAEDLLQEAALAAVRGFGTFQQGTNFKAWFFQILTNCFYGRHRRSAREGQTTDFEDVPELYLYERTAEIGLHGVADPARQALSRLDGDEIAAALGSLPEEYRVVSTLYFMEDFTYEQIASVLEVPVGTVRSRLHRGRKLLQRQLWRIALEHGIVSQTGQSRA
jgi:RNA polymerase sigma-70 factor (ECF subfamily)